MSADNQSGRVEPGRLAPSQGRRAFVSRREQLAGDSDLLGIEELIVTQRPVDRLVVHLDIRQQRGESARGRHGQPARQSVDFLPQRGSALR